ncbi:MAG: hypothetical protein LBC41_00095 [Clostridiales bacterium]|nr:hypothetical protein [Clostridiales bacterium]MDR2749032.1 hypothetical protein [Clostridiales bacterium]
MDDDNKDPKGEEPSNLEAPAQEHGSPDLTWKDAFAMALAMFSIVGPILLVFGIVMAAFLLLIGA